MDQEIKLQRTTMPIGSLIDNVDRGHLRLPEIQRDYVWKPAQIAGLLDSLYREYPSGSILLWETDDPVTERRAKIEPSGASPTGRSVQYLLDGQQRLTSLHRVLHEPEQARVVFNVVDERFQIQSAATKRDPRWVGVHEILHEGDLFGFVERLAQVITDVDRPVIGKRLGRLQGILKYPYHVEVIGSLPYEEVTEIFIRVNSKGRSLKTTDLALATLSAKWHGVMQQLEEERDYWRDRGYPAIDLAFLARCIASIGTKARTLTGFKDAPRGELEDAWAATKRGLRHLLRLLENNAGIETSTLLPSSNALVPLVAYLGRRSDTPLSPEEGSALLYWLFSAFLTGRFNQSADTRIAEDALAIRSGVPIESLYRNLGLLGGRVTITDDSLAGKGAGSPFFLLSYLAARGAGATDWFFGVRIGLDAEGGGAIEYHHIHPQATLKQHYSKAEINDLANLAFISSRANKRISNRSPARYFGEVGNAELMRHFVPLDPALRTFDAYPDFVRERRRLLADAMNSFLEAFRPAFLAEAVTTSTAATGLIVTVHRPAADGSGDIVEFRAQRDAQVWVGSTKLSDLRGFLADLEAGLTAALPLDGEIVTIEGGQDIIEVPVGPFVLTGSLDDWKTMMARELAQAEESLPVPTATSGPWAGDRVAFPVTEAE